MSWFIFAFLTAFFEATKDAFSKSSLKKVDEYIVSWAFRFFALPFILILLVFYGIPEIKPMFWVALLVSGTLNVITTIIYMKAIKASDLSLTVPIVTFTPLFLLITSPLIVGEFPGISGIAGIFLIVFGSYTLNIKKMHQGFLAPFKALLKEKGPRLMLLVAFIWSITSNFDKIGVENSSAIFWVASITTFIAFWMFPIMFYKSKNKISQIKSNWKALIPIGMFGSIALFCQMTAITMTLVPYVISIKRTSAIISALYGFFIFKEKGIKERLLGASIMVLGVVLITLF